MKGLPEFYEKYAEDNATLNDWIAQIQRYMNWKMFERQSDWIYMNGELGEGTFPCVKDEIYRVYCEEFNSYLGWLREWMFIRFLMTTRLGNVDLGQESECDLREELGDEEYEQWEANAKQLIFDEYAQMIGEENAKALFGRNWGEGWND